MILNPFFKANGDIDPIQTSMNQFYKISCQDSAGIHQIAYQDWGTQQREKVLICVHGLSRNSKDFDQLAEKLQSDYRIIAIDIVGRGESDWLSNPADYGVPLYLSDVLTLIQQLNLTAVDWLGTSMGGIMGMTLAALPNSPIKRLILNDVGAWIPTKALQRIAGYLCQEPPIFRNLHEVTEYVKKTYASFGNLTEKQWDILAKNSVKGNEMGQYILNYDRRISTAFQGLKAEDFQPIDLWQIWNLVQCPVLLLKGVNSDLLLAETVEKMKENHPLLEIKFIPDCGHAPALMSLEQIEIICSWLNQNPSCYTCVD